MDLNMLAHHSFGDEGLDLFSNIDSSGTDVFKINLSSLDQKLLALLEVLQWKNPTLLLTRESI